MCYLYMAQLGQKNRKNVIPELSELHISPNMLDTTKATTVGLQAHEDYYAILPLYTS